MPLSAVKIIFFARVNLKNWLGSVECQLTGAPSFSRSQTTHTPGMFSTIAFNLNSCESKPEITMEAWIMKPENLLFFTLTTTPYKLVQGALDVLEA